MFMRAIICAALLVQLPASALADKTVVLASEEWEAATNADGSGFYWDLMRLVFEPAGYTVKNKTVPYARSVKMVENGSADAWVGSYIDEEDFAVYPEVAFDADVVSAAVLAGGEFDPARGQSSLAGKNVGWVRGYGYDDYLEVPVEVNELNDRETGFKMLVKGRIDALLDARAELENTLATGVVDASRVEIHELLELKLYSAFADTDRGRELKRLWDARMRELHSGGELREFYDDAGYTEFYPF